MIIYLISAFILLQAGDIWTTWRLLSQGGRELNPLMAKLFSMVGVLPGLLIAKGALLALLVSLSYHGSLPIWLLFVACVAYIVVVIHNWRQLRQV